MPIPVGAHQVPGNPNRVRLASGEIVTRYRALNLGAQQRGYESHRSYTNDQRERDNPNAKFVSGWLKSDQGKAALRRERALAKQEGRRFSRSEFGQRVIAARNERPTVANPQGGAAFQDFASRYDLSGDTALRY